MTVGILSENLLLYFWMLDFCHVIYCCTSQCWSFVRNIWYFFDCWSFVRLSIYLKFVQVKLVNFWLSGLCQTTHCYTSECWIFVRLLIVVPPTVVVLSCTHFITAIQGYKQRHKSLSLQGYRIGVNYILTNIKDTIVIIFFQCFVNNLDILIMSFIFKEMDQGVFANLLVK